MSVTSKKHNIAYGKLELERVNSVKKKLFDTNFEDNEIVITNTCKKSERDEKAYQMMMTCKGLKKANKQEVYKNVEESNRETIDILTRKRQQQPNNWKRNKAKLLREAGEEYVGYKEQVKNKKNVQYGCDTSCTYNCMTKISTIEREQINKQFYSLNDAQKYKYYNEYTMRKQTQRKRSQNENSRRKYSYMYYFANQNNNKEQVCKHFFCATLNISVKRVYHFYKKKDANITKIIPTPQKGKHVKKQTSPELIKEVKKHISSFPVQESHYCRSSSKRQYLDPSLSIRKMYALYVESVKEPVKENIYRKAFNENFNYGFQKPKKDRCDTCCEYKALKTPNESEQLKYEEHITRKKEGNDEREKDRKLNAEVENTAVITFDLENIFSLPKAHVSCFYYNSKLTVYNLTGHCNVNNSATNAVWDETKNGRSGDEIASALIKILNKIVENLPDNINKLILWSDSCVPQNKNSHMSMALINYLNTDKASKIKEIEQKFSEPGHGNVQEVDCVHSIIERNLRHQEIYSPLGLMRALLKIHSKMKLTFLQMQETDFYSYHEEAVKLGFGQIPYKKIKSIKYSKFNWNIVEFKTSFIGTSKLVDIRQKNINILNDLTIKSATNSLSDKKVQDIRSMFKYMPHDDKVYMETLLKNVNVNTIKNIVTLPSTSQNNINYEEPKKSITSKKLKKKVVGKKSRNKGPKGIK